MSWYTQSITQCAPWSYVVLVGQILLLSMLIERSVFLTVKARINSDLFLEQVRKLVLAGNADRAMKLCRAAGDMPLGKVCGAGLAARGQGPFAVEEALKHATAEQLPRIKRRLKTIPLLGIGLALVGVVGSGLLGAETPTFGGTGPLPFGLDMPFAPALLGVGSAIVALLAWLALRSSARSIVDGLEKGKKLLLELR